MHEPVTAFVPTNLNPFYVVMIRVSGDVRDFLISEIERLALRASGGGVFESAISLHKGGCC